jgi:hypothetical protein
MIALPTVLTLLTFIVGCSSSFDAESNSNVIADQKEWHQSDDERIALKQAASSRVLPGPIKGR